MGCGASSEGSYLRTRTYAKHFTFNKGKALEAIVWPGVGKDEFVFPELRERGMEEAPHGEAVKWLQSKPSVAVCLSGGGFRATTCAVGWVRGLVSLEVFQHIRYLCSNSGGSWLNIVLSFQNDLDLPTLLGELLEPSELHLDVAADFLFGSYEQTVSDAAFKMTPRPTAATWPGAIGEAFLAPHGLGDPAAQIQLHDPRLSTEMPVVAQQHCRHVYTACREQYMPFPIMVGTVRPRNDPKGRGFHSVEFTPLYSGVPAFLPDCPPGLGGVLVESAALLTRPPYLGLPDGIRQATDKEMPIHTHAREPLSLVKVAGVTSAFVDGKQTSKNKALRGFNKSLQRFRRSVRMTVSLAASSTRRKLSSATKTVSKFFGGKRDGTKIPSVKRTLHLWNGFNGQGKEMAAADGKGTDNLAVLPALRRGVKRILVCVANDAPIHADWAAVNWDMAGLFGVATDCDPAYKTVDAYNEHTQVFETSEWHTLMKALREKAASGGPWVVHTRALKVLPNKAQGVKGGYLVDVLWVVNGACSRWHKELPEKTRLAIETSDKFKEFPLIPTSKLDYKPELVGILSQLATWSITRSGDEITAFIKDQ